MATELAAAPERVEIDQLMAGISGLFEFSWLLLLPLVVVLAGSLMRQPALPTLLVSIFAAALLAVLMQPYSVLNGQRCVVALVSTRWLLRSSRRRGLRR